MSDWPWWQFGLLGWLSVCFFANGARSKGIALNRRTWFEIAQAALIVVILFALVSEGRGCSRTTTFDPDLFCVGEPQC
jgi:hypothetical protein